MEYFQHSIVPKLMLISVLCLSIFPCYSDVEDQFCVPCGGCRQVIAEFGYANNCLVLLVKPSGKIKRVTIKELLPSAFTPEDLTTSTCMQT